MQQRRNGALYLPQPGPAVFFPPADDRHRLQKAVGVRVRGLPKNFPCHPGFRYFAGIHDHYAVSNLGIPSRDRG